MKPFVRNRNYEKYAEAVPKITSRPVVKEEITIACILQPSTFNFLTYECSLLPITKQNYANILKNKKVDLLLVETPSSEGIDEWNNIIFEILAICKENKIINAFWDTDGKSTFNNNLDLIKQFNTIFTINSNLINEYKNILMHQQVYFLPFAVQPRIYNPIERNIMSKEDSISRKSGIKLERIPGFPHKIYSVLYDKMSPDELYWIPEEIFQLLGLGTTMISPYYRSLEELFPDIKLYKSNIELEEIKNKLLKDRDAVHKLSVLAQRNVHCSHTYTNRINTILEKTGLIKQPFKLPGVTMITSTNRPDSMENVFMNYQNQNYENKELIVILNNNKMDLEKWENKAQQYKKVKVFQVDEKQPLGRCLNHAIDNSDFPYLSKCDDDNYYATNFLSDLMNAFKYADAEIVGKLSYYCYLEGCRTLAIMCPNMEYRYVNMLSGSALIIKREVFEKVRFRDKPAGSDTVFLKECINNGIRMYSADRFNYIYKRHASQENHTWKMSDDVFLRSCKIVDITDDYIPRVTV
jgi:hypothetical protein